MTTSMTDHHFHGRSGLSLIQLEEMLLAAHLLLEAWRTTPRPDLKGNPMGLRREENVVCP